MLRHLAEDFIPAHERKRAKESGSSEMSCPFRAWLFFRAGSQGVALGWLVGGPLALRGRARVWGCCKVAAGCSTGIFSVGMGVERLEVGILAVFVVFLYLHTGGDAEIGVEMAPIAVGAVSTAGKWGLLG